MRVKNNTTINRLSDKYLIKLKNRNIIAIIAIAMTGLLFTALFTVTFSLNSIYETYTFRQIGGYSHGSFKDVSKDDIIKLSKSKRIKEYGIRKNIGFISDGAFSKMPAEINYLDNNVSKWSYIEPTYGRLPKENNEIAMDTEALKKLGAEPKIGCKLSLTYEINDKSKSGMMRTDDFILSGFWDYDEILPVHFINISEEYADKIEAKKISDGMQNFRIDMEVMLRAPFNISNEMNSILEEAGYSPYDTSIGVNWAYISSHFFNNIDIGTVATLLLLIIIIILTGYLIISNVFQISVSADIRYYGLLKTIGFTSKQIRKIVLRQAIILSVIAIPLGVIAGYGIGYVLMPFIIRNLDIIDLRSNNNSISGSFVIFILSVFFAFITVIISSFSPAKFAGKVSPIEAVKYVETNDVKKRKKMTRSNNVFNIACSNFFRNKTKTMLVICSIAFSLILLNTMVTFVSGFNMEKYLQHQSSADFIVSSPDYFRFRSGNSEQISESTITEIRQNTEAKISGCGYVPDVLSSHIYTDDERKHQVKHELLIEGFDEPLIEKLKLVEGELDFTDKRAIALVCEQDDYGKPIISPDFPEIDEAVIIDYVREVEYYDSRTGEPVTDNTPDEFITIKEKDAKHISYNVTAYVTVPYSMGLRYSILNGYKAVLPKDILAKDSGKNPNRLFYLFDAGDERTERNAERYLNKLTSTDNSLMYESKAKTRQEFENFRRLFVVVGSLICMIIGFIGILNFFNTILTSFFSRKRELAVMQAIGMTSRQMRKLLVYESNLYITLSVASAAIICTVIHKPLGDMLSNIFWFFDSKTVLLPLICVIPALYLIGIIVPAILYQNIKKTSIIDRIRE